MLYVLFVFLLFSLIKNLFDYQKNLRFYEGMKQDLREEKKTNITLKTQILRNRDPQELEKTIRNKLNLLKESEMTIIISTPTPAPRAVTPTPPPVYKQWLNLLF